MVWVRLEWGISRVGPTLETHVRIFASPPIEPIELGLARLSINYTGFSFTYLGKSVTNYKALLIQDGKGRTELPITQSKLNPNIKPAGILNSDPSWF